MKSLRYAGFGPPSVLRIEEVAIPVTPLCRERRAETLQASLCKGSSTKVKRTGAVP